ncbi:MAG: DUF72 domain-containing protein [Luteibaculaceae bacterium]
MDYGKTSTPENLFFTPPKPLFNLGLLEHNSSTVPQVYLGGTVFGVKEWKGTWFPEKLPQKQFLKTYSNNLFNCIELNATHYKIYTPEHIAAWKRETNRAFRFCPKFPQIITHFRRFANVKSITDEFLVSIASFDENLGPSFIQLPPNFTNEKIETLLYYLDSLPTDIQLSIEFRHPSWFLECDANFHFFLELKKRNIGLVISDTALRRDACHMLYTAPFVLVRFGGYFGSDFDLQRFHFWKKIIIEWSALGVHQFYFFIHQENSIKTPESVLQFHQILQPEITVNVPLKSQNNGNLTLF